MFWMKKRLVVFHKKKRYAERFQLRMMEVFQLNPEDINQGGSMVGSQDVGDV